MFFMFGETVNVAVESDPRALVPEDFGEGFYVHSAFEGARGESVAQRVKAPVRNVNPREKGGKTFLI